MKKLIIALCLAALAGIAPVPAGADHANGNGAPDGGHWGNRYAPAVGYCFINSDRSANVADAAYYWQDTFLPQGYQPPLPRATYQTGAMRGWINSCELEPGHSLLNGREGRTYRQVECDNACNHIVWAVVYTANNLAPYRRQQTWRHEWGHGVGLGHTVVLNARTQCVMYETGEAALGSRCRHDIDAMHTMYDHVGG